MKTIVKIKENEESILVKLRENDKILYKTLPFKNYIYVTAIDYEELEMEIAYFVEDVFDIKDKDGIWYKKLILKNNYHRNLLRKKIEDDFNLKTFEADITSPKRFIIDNPEMKLNQKDLKVAFYDFETFDLNPLQNDFKGNLIPVDPILSVAIKDMDGKTLYFRNQGIDGPEFDEFREQYTKYTKDRTRENYSKIKSQLDYIITKLEDGEKIFLNNIVEAMREYDVFWAWNGDRFDKPYLESRLKYHGMSYDSLWVKCLDYMVLYKKNTWVNQKSYSLNNVSKFELGSEVESEESRFKQLDEVKKIDWKEKTGLKKFFELFLLEEDLLKEYNIQDVNLMYMIEQKLNFFGTQYVMTDLGNVLIEDTLFNSKIIDNKMLIMSHEKDIVCPTKKTKEQLIKITDKKWGDHVSGGFTFCFLRGLHKILKCFDFAGHYPTDMITHNISPETFVRCYEPDLSLLFAQNEIDFLTQVFKMYETREFLKVDGKLQKKKYEDAIEEIRETYKVEKTMEDLMWAFTENYRDQDMIDYVKENDLTFANADLNYDTKGWRLHPFRLFKRTAGVLSTWMGELLSKRNVVKYALKQIGKEKGYDSPEYKENDSYQAGLKELANSGYGASGLKAFRFYNFDVADGITSSCRFLTKKFIIFCRAKGIEITHGDSIIGSSKININNKIITIEKYFNQNIKKVKNNRNKEIIDVTTNFDKTLAIKNVKYKQSNMNKSSERVYQKHSLVNKIIRHKTKKKLYRITTESGKRIIVTEDHSVPAKRDNKYIEPLTKNLKVGDFVFVESNTGFCSNDSWNKGMKPKEWMSEEKYTKWKKDKKKNSCFNLLGHGGISKNEKVLLSILKDKGFKFEPKYYNTNKKENDKKPSKFKPDFVNEDKKIIIEFNGSLHLKKYNKKYDKDKKDFFEKIGYKLLYINFDEKQKGRPITLTKKMAIKLIKEVL